MNGIDVTLKEEFLADWIGSVFYFMKARKAYYLQDKADKKDIGRQLGSKMARDLTDAYCRLAVLKKVGGQTGSS